MTDFSFLLKDGYNLLELIIQFEFIITLDYDVKNSTTHHLIIILQNKQERKMIFKNVEKKRNEKYKQKTKKKNENQR